MGNVNSQVLKRLICKLEELIYFRVKARLKCDGMINVKLKYGSPGLVFNDYGTLDTSKLQSEQCNPEDNNLEELVKASPIILTESLIALIKEDGASIGKVLVAGGHLASEALPIIDYLTAHIDLDKLAHNIRHVLEEDTLSLTGSNYGHLTPKNDLTEHAISLLLKESLFDVIKRDQVLSSLFIKADKELNKKDQTMSIKRDASTRRETPEKINTKSIGNTSNMSTKRETPEKIDTDSIMINGKASKTSTRTDLMKHGKDEYSAWPLLMFIIITFIIFLLAILLVSLS